MNVESILADKGSRDVLTIESDRTIQEAIDRLVEANVGSLVVIGDGGVAGIVTERDVLRCCAGNPGDLHERKVTEIMTAELIVGRLDDDLDRVMDVMTTNRIRHLPVLDGGELAGLVSIGDVVHVQLRQTRDENHHLKSYIAGSY